MAAAVGIPTDVASLQAEFEIATIENSKALWHAGAAL
jgi:hypothetical protein